MPGTGLKAAIFRHTWLAGGAESYLFDIAGCLRARGYDVHYLSTSPAPTAALAVLGRSDEEASFRRVANDASLLEKATGGYDLFLNAATHFPIAGRAQQSWLVVFAPGSGTPTPWTRGRRLVTASARRAADHLPPQLGPTGFRGRLRAYPPSTEAAALRSYDRVVGVSRFIADILSSRHRRRCDVLYPAVAPAGRAVPKEPLVVSIGRFSPWGNAKRQDVLLEAAAALAELRPEMRVALVGSLPDDPASTAYFRDLQQRASGLSTVELHVDAPPTIVADLLRRACAYWHGAGFAVDPARDPDSVEHFGMAIVEAMSAGAVPLVVPAGGPAEIVTDDVNGLYWSSPAELAELTAQVGQDDRSRRWADAAVVRSHDFSHDRMAATIDLLLEPTSDAPHG